MPTAASFVNLDIVIGQVENLNPQGQAESGINTGVTLNTADTGITLSSGGVIKGGQTAFNTGNGFFLGYSGAQYKVSIGDPSGDNITWDGADLSITANTGEVTGDLTVSGNLTVNGTTTTLNTATLDVEDKNITLNYGAGDTSSTANGAGITIQDAVNSTTNATILWNGTTDAFDFSNSVNITGNITVSGTVDGRDVATDGTKLDNIEALADVTDTINVTAAGALMDSEVTNLSQVKAFDSADYATAAQGATADSALQNVVEDTTPQLGGDLESNGNHILFADSDKAIFGAGSDLEIFHNGTTNVIKSTTSNIEVKVDGGGNFKVGDEFSNFMFAVNDNSDVQLYHGATPALKLATTSTGIDVTGTVTADGLTVDGTPVRFVSTSPMLNFMESGVTDSNHRLRQNAGNFVIQKLSDDEGTATDRFLIDGGTGDISFYEDTGTTAKLEWLASAEDLKFADNSKAIFGAGSDLSVYHTGSNGFIENDTGLLILKNNSDDRDVAIQSDDGSGGIANYLLADGSTGALNAYHYGSLKLATTSTGIDVTGTATMDGLTVDGVASVSSTNPKIRLFETDTTDLNTQIQNQAGDFKVSRLDDDAGSLTVHFEIDHSTGNVSIPSGDLDVTGTLTADGLTVDGSASNIKYDVASSDPHANPTFELKNQNATDGNVAVLKLSADNANGVGGSAYVYAQSETANQKGNLVFAREDGANTPVTSMKLSSNGNISFYEDTGTTAKLTWDASAESLNVTGTVVSDGATIAGTLELDSNNFDHTSATPQYNMIESDVTGNNTQFLQTAGDLRIRTVDDSLANPVERLRIDHATGDISFYEDTGTTAKFFWDSSAEALGIGTSSPGSLLELEATGSTVFDGTSTDGQAADGTTLAIQNLSDTNDTFSQILFRNRNASKAVSRIASLTDATGTEMAFVVENNGSPAEVLRLEKTGHVGIGTSSPASPLHINTGANGNIIHANGASNAWDFILKGTNSNDTNSVLYEMGLYRDDGASNPNTVFKFGRGGGSQNGFFAIDQNGSEAMRINSSGNLLVSKTSSSLGTVGVEAKADGQLWATRDAGVALSLNRTTSDGTIAAFYRGGSAIGAIDGISSDLEIHSTASGHVGIRFGNGGIFPTNNSGVVTNGAADIGASTIRFKDLYLSANCRATSFVGIDDNDTLVRMGGSNVIQFFTANSERARFDASGNLLVGTTLTNPTTGSDEGIALGATGIMLASNANDAALAVNRVSSNGDVVVYKRQGVQVGSVSVSGTNATFNTSSDQRLKENIVDAPSASDDIDAIQVRSFDWKADGSHQKYGMVAQELNTVAPEAVSAPEDPEDMMGVDYSKLVPMLVKEIQSLRARVAQLETN